MLINTLEDIECILDVALVWVVSSYQLTIRSPRFTIVGGFILIVAKQACDVERLTGLKDGLEISINFSKTSSCNLHRNCNH